MRSTVQNHEACVPVPPAWKCAEWRARTVPWVHEHGDATVSNESVEGAPDLQESQEDAHSSATGRLRRAWLPAIVSKSSIHREMTSMVSTKLSCNGIQQRLLLISVPVFESSLLLLLTNCGLELLCVLTGRGMWTQAVVICLFEDQLLSVRCSQTLRFLDRIFFCAALAERHP